MATIALDGTSGYTEQFGIYAKAITPSDTDIYSGCFYVYVGVTGNVAIVPAGSTTAVTFVGVPAGSVVPCKAQAVYSTGTTATSLIALS